MPKYRVWLQTNAEFGVSVEAEDEEAAIEAAFEHTRGICAQCSGWGKDTSIDLGEWDLPREWSNAPALDTSEFVTLVDDE